MLEGNPFWRYSRRRLRQPIVRGGAIAGNAWHRLLRQFERLELNENTLLLGFGVAIGAASALGVVVFYKLIDFAHYTLFESAAQRLSSSNRAVYRPLLTSAFFALAWWIMRRFGRGHDGLNIPDVQVAVARRGGVIPLRPTLARTAASAVTLGGGGSAGSEGPVAVLGAALGSFLGDRFGFGADRVRVLVAAGAAAGISAAFNTPLAGAFFALEEILGSFAVRAFAPVILSSVVGALVSHSFFGNNPAFPIPIEYGYALRREVVLFFPLLGVVAGLASVGFIRLYFWTDSITRNLRVHGFALALIGGALVGVLAFISGGALVGFGHLAIQLEVFGRMAWWTLALLAAGKMLATALTLNTGGSGGVFTPSLFVGAATGGAFGVLLAGIFPSLEIHAEAYALVGMGAVVAAATAAPITGILIVFEMTNDYAIMMPLMVTTVIAFVVRRHYEPDSLYSGWLRRRGEHLEHGADRDVLAQLVVADALNRNPQVVGENATLAQLVERLDSGSQSVYPVVDHELHVVGMISLADLGRAARDQAELAALVVAADLAAPVDSVAPRDSLLATIRRLGVRGTGALPVVDPRTSKLIGMISHADILACYERSLAGANVGDGAPVD